MAVIELKHPISFDGEEVKEVNLDFDSLTGEHILSAERQYSSSDFQNQGNMAKEFSKEYQMYVAAQAAKMPVEFFKQLKGLDFSRVTIAVQNFFLDVSAE